MGSRPEEDALSWELEMVTAGTATTTARCRMISGVGRE